MLRRCILELSSGRSVPSRHKQITAQTPFFLSSRKNFSQVSQKNTPQRPASTEKSSYGSYVSKLFLGSVAVVAAFSVAQATGYIDLRVKNEKPSINSNRLDATKTAEHLEHPADQVNLPSKEQESKLNPERDIVKENDEPDDHKDPAIIREVISEEQSAEELTPVPLKENKLSSFSQEITSTPDEQTSAPVEQTTDFKLSSVDTLSLDSSLACKGSNEEQKKAAETSDNQNVGIDTSANVSEENDTNKAAMPHVVSIEIAEGSLGNKTKAQKPLAQSYSLQSDEVNPEVSGEGEATDYSASLKDKEASTAIMGTSQGNIKSDGGKIVLDLVEAIDAAKRKQAELDAYIFTEEKRTLKEKYEKELKDARARELMYAEEAAILDKELNKEKMKAATAVKLLQEKAEQNLREELQRKEEETAIELKKVQELAKAELAAAIAIEKSSQIEKIAEANLHVNALCMAFYARSEEARQTHSIHKLALQTLELEDALSRGLPIRAEVNALHKLLEGIDRDLLLDMALTSLPEEALNHGTVTQMQLYQKFDSLKGSLRHFSLIPAGGGGILAHTVAHIASSIKVSEEDQLGEGIESLISKVDRLLAEGKIAEAAESLEGGVRGSEAEGVVAQWARQARDRAVAEQTLSLLQSYASSFAFSQS